MSTLPDPDTPTTDRRLIVQFEDADGVSAGPEIELSLNTDRKQLAGVLNQLLASTQPDDEDRIENAEFNFEVIVAEKEVDELPHPDKKVTEEERKKSEAQVVEVCSTLEKAIDQAKDMLSSEQTLKIRYVPLSLFKVKPVTRCSSSMTGHSEAVLCARFSPDCRYLATGSGDTTVRLWDLNTEICCSVLKGHQNHVLTVEWSPCGNYLASGGMDKSVMVWDRVKLVGGKRNGGEEEEENKEGGENKDGENTSGEPDAKRQKTEKKPYIAPSKKKGKNGKKLQLQQNLHKHILKGHREPVTSLCWQPLHCAVENTTSKTIPLLASCSKDGTTKLWDVLTGNIVRTLSSHTAPVMQVKWSGENKIITAGRDRTIKYWEAKDGSLIRTMKGHAHWINSLQLNTDYVLRTGGFEPKKIAQIRERQAKNLGVEMPLDANELSELQKTSLARYKHALAQNGNVERLLSGSDDFSLFLWDLSTGKNLARLVGHQQPIPHCCFSPDGAFIASASFDKSIRLWDGRTGRFICALRGHVQKVFQLSWSADSRLLMSGSADSTLKVWDVQRRKLLKDLPGHADEVYATDWAQDGSRACSGSKDRVVKMWRF